MKTLKLDEIRIDEKLQAREFIDQETVYKYLEDMKNGDEFPPMETVFDGTIHWLVDGFHRYHAYKLLGLKEVDIKYRPGTFEEAQNLACGMNGKHGKPRTLADRRRAVLIALNNPLNEGVSDYEIAKICGVSRPFVGSVRDPEVKARQDQNRAKSAAKKAEKQEKAQSITKDKPLEVNPQAGAAPDDEEIKASELAQQFYLEEIEKVMSADDKLAQANETIKNLTHQLAQSKIRNNSLIDEKNEAIRILKRTQTQLDKLKAKK